MNKRLLCHLVGNVVRVCGALMAVPLIVSLILFERKAAKKQSVQ